MRMAFWERVFVNSFIWDWYLRRRLRAFLGHVPAAPVRILEVGCGKGTTTQALAGAFPRARVLAVDIDPGQVALARRRLPALLHGRITVRTADATRLPGRFDAVAEFHTLHHVEDWRGLLRGMLRHVRPGGRFICLDIGGLGLWRFAPALLRPYFPCGPSFTRDAVLGMLRAAGFTVEHLQGKYHFAVIARKHARR